MTSFAGTEDVSISIGTEAMGDADMVNAAGGGLSGFAADALEASMSGAEDASSVGL
jgi:hypothetical protein